MTMKHKRYLYTVVLSFIVILNTIVFIGCSEKSVIDSPIYHSRLPINQIIIERPPTRIVYAGTVTKDGRDFTNECLDRLDKTKYHNYKFNKSFSSNVGLYAKTCESNTNNSSFSSERKK